MFYSNKLSILILIIFTTTTACAQWDELKDASDKAQKKKDEIMGEDGGSSKLTEEEIVKGLKDALKVGAENSVDMASKVDGFNKNPNIRIPFPPEAEKVKKKALELGMDQKVEKFEKTMNRAAEKASKKATDIFVEAVRNMTVKEGRKILNGDSTAATEYLNRNTYDQLYTEFKPIVEEAIDKVELTKYWNPLAQAYNQSTMLTGEEKVNPDLDEYVTEEAIDGLFFLIAKEEKKIRRDPVARVTDILKKVFG